MYENLILDMILLKDRKNFASFTILILFSRNFPMKNFSYAFFKPTVRRECSRFIRNKARIYQFLMLNVNSMSNRSDLVHLKILAPFEGQFTIVKLDSAIFDSYSFV